MNYKKLRKIVKLQVGGKAQAIAQFRANHASELTGYENDDMIWNMLMAQPIDDSEPEEILPDTQKQQAFLKQEMKSQGITQEDLAQRKADLESRGFEISNTEAAAEALTQNSGLSSKGRGALAAIGGALGSAAKGALSSLGGQMGEMGTSAMSSGIQQMIAGDLKGGGAALGAGAAVAAMGAVDKQLMGDKNFGAQSEAIDQAVHGVSGSLMKSGNPIAIGVGVALEGVNFLTKAGGQTVQGFDVDINSSGYGNLGHMESRSDRNLFGINNKGIEERLLKRNEQARMALKAASISEDQSFEQEARMNSVTNTIMQNQQALSGGIDLQNI